jgi:winged helix-turn-helix DNA-binding protein
MADVVSDVRAALERRLRELEPLVKEHAQIRDALERLADAVGPPRRRLAPGPAARQKASGRPRGSGARAQQAVKLVQDNPGITISELAKKMRLKSPNYLYRVMPQLEKDGKVKREGKGYHPVA